MIRTWWVKRLFGRPTAPRIGRPTARPRLTQLEDRLTPTTAIDFAGNTLTLTANGAGETVTLSVAGTTLSVTSTDAGGTTATPAAQALGFSPTTGQNAANTGSIAAANDVRAIVVNGAVGTQTVVFAGGTFTAATVANTIESASFAINPSTFTAISPAAANGSLLVQAGQIAISQNVTTSGGTSSQSYQGAVDVTANVVLSSAADVTFGAAVDSTTTSGLTVNAPGATTFGAAVGGTNPLASLTTDAGGTTSLVAGAGVKTTGAQTYNDTVTLAGDTTLEGSTVTFTGQLALGTNTLTVTGNFAGSGAGAKFSTTLNGAAFGKVVASGSASLGGATLDVTFGPSFVPRVGTTFQSFDLVDTTAGMTPGFAGGPTYTFGSVSFAMTYAGGADGKDAVLTVGPAGQVFVDDDWAGTADGKDPASDPNPPLFFNYNAFADIQPAIDAVAANGTVTVYGSKVGSNYGGFTTKPLAPFQIAVNSTLAAQTEVRVGGPVVLASPATFNLVDADLTFTAGAPVTGAGPITVEPAPANKTLRIGADVTTTGFQKYDVPVVLTNTVTLTTTNSDITFGSTLDGTAADTQGLTLTAGGGNVTFTGKVGNAVRPGDVIITSAKNVTISAAFAAKSLVQQAGTGTTTNNGPVSTFGPAGINSTTNALAVNANLTANGGPVSLTTVDQAGTGQDVTIGAGVTVQSAAGDVTIRAGDDLIAPSANIKAVGNINLAVDYVNLDPGVGGTANLSGAVLQAGAANKVFLDGDNDNDSFTLSPGPSPVFVDGKGGTDTLTVTFPAASDVAFGYDFAGAFPASVTVGANQPIAYKNVEVVQLNGPVNGVTVNGSNDKDFLTAELKTAALFKFQLTQFAAAAPGGSFAFPEVDLPTPIQKFTFNGNGGDDEFLVRFTIDPVTKLPLDPVPAGGILFNGGAGIDCLAVVGTGTEAAQFRPTAATPGSGQVTVNGGKPISYQNINNAAVTGNVDLSGFASVTAVLANAGDDNVKLAPGVSCPITGAVPALVLTDNSGKYDNLVAENNGLLTIDTSAAIDGANDAVEIAGTGGTAHNNARLAVTTGAGANDQVTVTAAASFAGGVAQPTVAIATAKINLSANLTAVTGDVSLTHSGLMATAVNPVVVTAGGNFGEGTGGVALGTNLTVSAGANATFGSAVDGPAGLAVNSPGVTTFSKSLGAATRLAFVSTDAAGTTTLAGAKVQTTGAQGFADPVTVTAAGTTTFDSSAAGNVTFSKTLSGGSDVRVNTAGLTTFGGTVTVNSLATDAAGRTAVAAPGVNATVTDLSFGDPVSVTSAATTFSAARAGAFAQSLDGASRVTVTAPAAAFSGPVGGTARLASLVVNGSAAVNGGLVATDLGATGLQTFNGPVTVGSSAAFDAGGSVTFNGTLQGAAVQVNSPGTTAFNGAVTVAALTTDAAGSTAVNGGTVTTTVSGQTFGDPVTVGQDTTFAAASNDVVFVQSLSGPVAVTVLSIGQTVFGGPVHLGSLATDIPGSTVVTGGTIATTAGQQFSDPVVVGAAATFAAGGPIGFGQTLSGGFPVLAFSPTTTLFGGAVSVFSLATDAPGVTVITGGTVTTAGGQSFADPVQVGSLGGIFRAGGDVAFGQSLVSDNSAVQVFSPGTTAFNGPVATFSLATDAAGATVVAGGSVSTPGDQSFGDPVAVTADLSGFTAGGSVVFAQGVDAARPGAQTLAVNTSTGNQVYAGPVGATAEFLRVILVSAVDVLFNAGLRAVHLVQLGGTGTTTFAGPAVISGAAGMQITTGAIGLGSAVLVAGDTVLNPQGGGVNQTGGSLRAPSLGLTGAGAFNMDSLGNDFQTVRIQLAGGSVRLADANDLSVDGGRGGLVTPGGDVFIRTGHNFTAIDDRTGGRLSTPLINVGGGRFTAQPGLLSPATVRLDAEVTAGDVFFGTPNGDNNQADTFLIRPSANAPITVYGNAPSAPLAPGQVGDRLLPNFDGAAVSQFQSNGTDGFYEFSNRQKLTFFSIESLVGRSATAFVVQTAEPHDPSGATQIQYAIRIIQTQLGQDLGGGVNGGALLQNPFIVAPSVVNPVSPTLAPRIAFGDVNGDGAADLIVANGPGAAPVITVINGLVLTRGNQDQIDLSKPETLSKVLQVDVGNGRTIPVRPLLAQFYAYDPQFYGGVNLAVGDLDGDGRAEIVTGADLGGGPHVRRFRLDPVDPTPSVANSTTYNPVELDSFLAFEPTFRGGVRVAIGNVNGKGLPELVLAAGAGGGPRVVVLDGDGRQANGRWGSNGVYENGTPWTIDGDFFAYDPSFRGGVFVDVGNFNSDKFADILTGPGGGAAHIRVFDGAGLTGPGVSPGLLANFFALGAVNENDPLFGPGGAVRGVGGVAFGGQSETTGFRSILVASGRGPKSRVEEWLRSADGSVALDKRNRPDDGNLITDTRVTKATPVPADTAALRYGGTVAGFSVAGDVDANGQPTG